MAGRGGDCGPRAQGGGGGRHRCWAGRFEKTRSRCGFAAYFQATAPALAPRRDQTLYNGARRTGVEELLAEAARIAVRPSQIRTAMAEFLGLLRPAPGRR